MAHKHKNLRMQVLDEFRSRFRPGTSKHKAKMEYLQSGGDRSSAYCLYIYSYKTFEVYKEHAIDFCDWLKAHYPQVKLIGDGLPYVDEWLQACIDKGYSPSTLKTKRAAICKLYNVPSSAFIELPERTRAIITRSRKPTPTDRNFNEQRHKELVEFARSTGLRRSELEGLRGDMLIYLHNKPYLDLTSEEARKLCKGGRPRYVPIVGDIEAVVARCKAAGHNKVWPVVNVAADIHAYRADYAKRVYQLYARPVDEIPRSERYYCQGDMRGTVLDRKAMESASKALGHSRIDVIAGHYLY